MSIRDTVTGVQHVGIPTTDLEGTIENGAINHFALDSTDIEASFAEAQKLGLNFAEGSIQHIDTFWSNGIRYFNVLGPNHEVIEFCQIM